MSAFTLLPFLLLWYSL